MTFKNLLKTNVFLIVFYFISCFLGDSWAVFSFLKALTGILIILLAGLNFAVLLKILLKKDFDFWEIVNFSFLSVLVFYPLFLALEFIFLKKIYNFFPFLNQLVIFGFLFLLFLLKKIDQNNFFLSLPKVNKRDLITSPLAIALLIKTAVIITIFSAYTFLPDKDPFKWLFRLSELFENNQLSPETYRPFFSGITYIFTQITGISIFYFFKYIIPFLSLSIVFSVWLFSRKMKSKNAQLLVLLSSLITPNIILYSQTAMPQVFTIFLTYYFVSFLIYYHQKRDLFYYLAAGLISFFSIFYHEISAILFFIWIIFTLIYFRKKISIGKRDILYIIIILLSNLSLFKIDFIHYWFRKISLLFAEGVRINLLFPAQYVNIDGNAMGWNGLGGISKFYAYYVGPLLFLVLVLIVLNLIRNIDFRIYLKEKLKYPELTILLCCFLSFFTISEILPRIINISILPDRAWIFGGIFSTLFLFLLINYLENKKTNNIKINLLFLTTLLIVIYGAFFINNQKKYLITKNEIASAKWIKENLPENRVIVSSTHHSIIKYYSNSTLIPVSKNFYYEDKSLKIFENKETYVLLDNSELLEYALNTKKDAEELISFISNNENIHDVNSKSEILSKSATNNITSSRAILSKINSSKRAALSESSNIYIYYSEKSSKNPYISRPYELAKNLPNSEFVFDNYPQRFEKIYEKDGDGKVIIWKVL